MCNHMRLVVDFCILLERIYCNSGVMGKWLNGLLHQEIANDVGMVRGLDESWASIYGFLCYLRPGYSLARQYLCVLFECALLSNRDIMCAIAS